MKKIKKDTNFILAYPHFEPHILRPKVQSFEEIFNWWRGNSIYKYKVDPSGPPHRTRGVRHRGPEGSTMKREKMTNALTRYGLVTSFKSINKI